MNNESYRIFCLEEKTIPLFMQPDWLEAVCDKNTTWHVLTSKNTSPPNGQFEEETQAVLVYCLKIKYGLRQIIMPPFTQFTGIWFSENLKEKIAQNVDYQQVVIAELIEQLPKQHRLILQFHYDLSNIDCVKQAGFMVSQRHTQVIEDVKDVDTLYRNLSRDIPRNIKKARKHFHIAIKNDFDTFYRISNNVYERQKSPNPVPLSIWRAVHTLIHEKNYGKVYYALDHNNEAHAVVMVVWDASTCYDLASGSTDKGRKYGGSTQLLWQAISDSIGVYQTFNFLGSTIPAIEAYNSCFNVSKKYYFKIIKYKNRAVKHLFKLLKK